ncbi:CinA family protein [archaeon]|nr:CinA family protein [archaeon]
MENLSKKVGDYCIKNNIKLTTAESCTAGLISATIAMTPGSSAWLDRGFVVYSAQAKNEMLGVSLDTIERFNITSEQVAKDMAIGALSNSTANVSLAVTGIAGPSGGTDEIPVGTICMAWARGKNDVKTETLIFNGNRNEIRESVVTYMLNNLICG